MEYTEAIRVVRDARDYLAGVADGDSESAEAAHAASLGEALAVLGVSGVSGNGKPELYSGYHVLPRSGEYVADAQIELPSGEGIQVSINGPSAEQAVERLDAALTFIRVADVG